jgi:hypothetical protein
MIASLLIAKAMPFFLQASPPNPGQMSPDQQFQIAMEALRHRGGSPGGTPGILALLVPFGLFAMIVGIIWLSYRNRQAQMQTQAAFQKQLLEKFSTGQEFSQFLESPGGQHYMSSMWSQNRWTQGRALRGLRAGIICTLMGLAFLALSVVRHRPGEIDPGILLLALGIGFLISAAVSRRLAERWKDQQEPDPGKPPAL